jgi:hypothetical protein
VRSLASRDTRSGAGAAGILLVLAALVVAACGSTAAPTAPAASAPSSTAGQVVTGTAQSRAASSQAALPGATPPPPPWQVPADQVALIRQAGLTPLGQEGTAQHTHSELQVWYQGSRVTVPAEIGIDAASQQLSPIHTHDRTGIVHVESPVPGTFRLGQFFVEWGVSLAGARAWVNGQAVADPAAVVLVDHQMIVVAWGAPPSPIPATYTDGYYPGVTPPDAAPGMTLSGISAGFGAPTVAARYNSAFGYLGSLADSALPRETPLVEGRLRLFEAKAWEWQGQGTVELLLWQFGTAAQAAAYRAGSAVLVPGTPVAATSVAPDAQMIFGPDPSRTDGSTLGQVAWTHGAWTIVLVEASASGVVDQPGLLRLAATAEQEAATLPAS